MVWTVADYTSGLLQGQEEEEHGEGIWEAVFTELTRLALDTRPEV